MAPSVSGVVLGAVLGAAVAWWAATESSTECTPSYLAIQHSQGTSAPPHSRVVATVASLSSTGTPAPAPDVTATPSPTASGSDTAVIDAVSSGDVPDAPAAEVPAADAPADAAGAAPAAAADAGMPWCDANATGVWSGSTEPLSFTMTPLCRWRVASAGDVLARFAHTRLLFVGDSMTRELLFDLLRHVAGCGTVTVRDDEARTGRRFQDTDVLGPRSAWASAVCAHVGNASLRQLAYTAVVPPLATGGGNVTFAFLWAPRIDTLAGPGAAARFAATAGA